MIVKYTGTWTESELFHLLRRANFGVTFADAKLFHSKSMDECIDSLFKEQPPHSLPIYFDNDSPEIAYGTTAVNAPYDLMKEEHRMLYIKSWYIGSLQKNTSIVGRMEMFWHNHFSTEFNTVKDSRYNYRYFELIREHAVGNFKKLLREITTNTQMLVYLNGNFNNKENPNENYARELQELFTIGKDADSHYTETDVKNAAKVLTGWKDDKEGIRTYFDPAFHNTDDKRFSGFYGNHVIKGRSGTEGAQEVDDLIEMICKQREVSKFICRKLYRWFVSSVIDSTVEKNVITPLSELLYSNNYEIAPVLKVLLTADFFYEPTFVGSIIKSPIDFIVELLRTFTIANPFEANADWRIWAILSQITVSMGQDIGNPPSVAGWPAYYEFPLYDKEWISSGRLFERHKLVKILTDKINPLDPESNVRIDVISFVNSLSNPADIKDLIDETVKHLFSISLGKTTIVYLHELLDRGIKYPEKWEVIWKESLVSKDKEAITEEVKTRLRYFLEALLTLPEYQIR